MDILLTRCPGHGHARKSVRVAVSCHTLFRHPRRQELLFSPSADSWRYPSGEPQGGLDSCIFPSLSHQRVVRKRTSGGRKGKRPSAGRTIRIPLSVPPETSTTTAIGLSGEDRAVASSLVGGKIVRLTFGIFRTNRSKNRVGL